MQCLEVSSLDSEHVTRYDEINLNTFKRHFQCLYRALILKLSLEEMMNCSTDDDVPNTSAHSFPSRAS